MESIATREGKFKCKKCRHQNYVTGPQALEGGFKCAECGFNACNYEGIPLVFEKPYKFLHLMVSRKAAHEKATQAAFAKAESDIKQYTKNRNDELNFWMEHYQTAYLRDQQVEMIRYNRSKTTLDSAVKKMQYFMDKNKSSAPFALNICAQMISLHNL